jgi:dihydrofolate synthase/folylpolyglutamate synthase
MTRDTSTQDDPFGYQEVEAALLGRWPETRLDPTLSRIESLVDLAGSPHQAYRVVHLTGTNGKTSTSRMVDALIRAHGLRTGRFTSPHVESMTERITIDGEPLSEAAFVEAYRDVISLVDIVDADGEHPMSYFEMMVAMAFAAFADAPVDVAVVEVGMGGAWDATNVVDADVAVITPIAVDHVQFLGERSEEIAVEKAGIIKAGSIVVVAEQTESVMAILAERARQVGATLLREGIDFGVAHRAPAVGGQMVSLQGLHGVYVDVFLPLYGAHQAQNAALALAATEALLADEALEGSLVEEAFGSITSPGRLEVVRRGPVVLLDAAHNPHGMTATVEAIAEAFTFDPLIGVVGVMKDKDVEGILAVLEPELATIVCTQNSTPRAMPAEELGKVAEEIFGEHRVRVVPRLDEAISTGVELAETGGALGESVGGGGLLITGSVVTVGQARTLLGGPR